MGQGGALDGKSVKLLPLGFPRGEAVAFSGSSEPMKVTDEGQRTVGQRMQLDEWYKFQFSPFNGEI